jgi:hypothetical protein
VLFSLNDIPEGGIVASAHDGTVEQRPAPPTNSNDSAAVLESRRKWRTRKIRRQVVARNGGVPRRQRALAFAHTSLAIRLKPNSCRGPRVPPMQLRLPSPAKDIKARPRPSTKSFLLWPARPRGACRYRYRGSSWTRGTRGQTNCYFSGQPSN